ncbi:MAG TPA: hypothetical protein VJR04_10330 [Terriglobales bacterium]|nr:hypothetical protein [Terriglobales bacterium]
MLPAFTPLRKLLLICGFAFLALIPGFAQATRETLQYLGTSQLDAIPATGISADDLQISPHPETDGELAGIRRGPGNASIPVIANPQAVVPASSVALAFNGLTHRDQRLAGTGAYANTQFSTEPPDEALAVGNGFVLQAVNAALAVYDANTGALKQGPTALNQFFRLKPEINRSSGTFGDFTSDPRAYYDTQLQRWFVTVAAISTRGDTGTFTAPTHLLIAVSTTSDPTQDWKIYSIDTTSDGVEGCPCYGDQPLIGADAHGFFISTNAFSLREGFAGVQLYAISKNLLASGAMPAIVHWSGPKLPGGFAFSVQPAKQSSFSTDDAAHGVEYFSSVADIRNMLDRRIAVWAITNTASLADAAPVLKLQNKIVETEQFGVPPDAPQRPGNTELGSLVAEKVQFIATNDHRMQQTVFSGGRLWSALTTIAAVGNDPMPHAGIAYFAVTPSISPEGNLKAEVADQGYVAVHNADAFHPALSIAQNGNGVIAFTLSGSDYYPSAAMASLTPNGASEIQIVAPGAAPHDGFSGYKYFGAEGAARTGDYSAATVDDHGELWIAAEYIPLAPRTLLANWGTFIAQIAPVK